MTTVCTINVRDKSVNSNELNPEIRAFGNRGLTAKVLMSEVNPKCDPIGPENKLIFALGIFAGTTLPTAHRLSVGAKSPLTGGIKESNVGGNLAYALAGHGIRMLIVEDSPADDHWNYVHVAKDGKVELIPADEYCGLNTYAFVEKMYEIYGQDSAVAAIGVAGELGYEIACIMVTDHSTGHPSRAAGRGGLGAVMGSKKIKGIVVEKATTRQQVEYADKERFMAANKSFIEAFDANPGLKGLGYAGTHSAIEATAPMNIMPVRNFSGVLFETERLQKMNLNAFLGKIKQNGGKTGLPCQPGCLTKCSNEWRNEKGEYVTSGLEYETTVLCGPNCDIDDLEYLAQIDRICDDFAVDTMEIGNALAVCMDAGKIAWGDKDAALNLINEMINGSEFGKVLGQGTASVGKFLGSKRIPTVKGQGIAAYDPRNLKGQGVTYAISAQGADHTTGNALAIKGVDHADKTGKVQAMAPMQMVSATIDNIGCSLCASVGMAPHILPEMFAGLLGGEWDIQKVIGIGAQTLAIEKAFNKAAGFTDADDKLPEFFSTEPNAQNNVWDITGEELAKIFPF